MRNVWAIAMLVSASIVVGYGLSLLAADTPQIAQVNAPRPTPSKIPTKSLILVLTRGVIGLDERLIGQPAIGQQSGDRRAMLTAIDYSLRYLATDRAVKDYQRLANLGISRDRVQRSLQRFRQLLVLSRSAQELQAAVDREFAVYQATGKDGQGTVGFTGYFEPVHVASPTRTNEFRYPIFRLPSNFSAWKKPHPTRAQLEGANGLQFNQSALKGNEIAWLRDRLEAFLIQVQGSARLQLTNGKTMTVGYAGATDYPYVGIGRELVKDGKFKLEDLTLPRLTQYFQQHPADLDVYLPRNQRFVFFKETGGAPAIGSLGVPVVAERSIATDKTLFPPGALALIQTQIPYPTAGGQLQQRQVHRFVLDQDTGSAIKGAGRVDIFMGTGKLAGDRAGLINATGQLYYLLLKR
ncbi:MAG: murein transglycosylase A [Leptolyngbyaceae cyanobacterium bins.302]|nr:murein transglycosylase A [Leptolyngbyaceae cyanobacterium bins.302]